MRLVLLPTGSKKYFFNDKRLLGTPSPMPGQDESPFMTWGQLEATPQRAMTPGGASVGGGQTTANPTVSNAPAFYLGDGESNRLESLRIKLFSSE